MSGHSEGIEGTEGPATRELSLKGQTHRQLAHDNRGHHGKCQAGNTEHRTPGVDLEVLLRVCEPWTLGYERPRWPLEVTRACTGSNPIEKHS